MYEGDKSCKALKVRIKILNFMCSLIGNQCRSFKIGVIWLNFEENVIKHAVAFCPYCSFLTAYFGRLYRRLYRREYKDVQLDYILLKGAKT